MFLNNFLDIKLPRKDGFQVLQEIKSDEDQEEITRAKEKWGKDHFKRLNEKLRSANPIDFSEEFRDDVSTLYTFELLRPMDYDLWFSNLQKGVIWIK